MVKASRRAVSSASVVLLLLTFAATGTGAVVTDNTVAATEGDEARVTSTDQKYEQRKVIIRKSLTVWSAVNENLPSNNMMVIGIDPVCVGVLAIVVIVGLTIRSTGSTQIVVPCNQLWKGATFRKIHSVTVKTQITHFIFFCESKLW
jgi:hypothetical protein